MNLIIKLLLTVLLIITFTFNYTVFAEIAESGNYLLHKSVQGSKKKGKHQKSICSIFVGSHGPRSMVKGYVKSFSNARGRLILFGKSIASLSSIASLIYKGNNNSIDKKKVINLRASHLGSIITLRGVGMSGKGYSLTLNMPNVFCADSKRRSSYLASSIVKLSFGRGSSSISSLNASIIGNRRVIWSSKGATIKGKIIAGNGEGRFVINLGGK